jgi:hypothetical protein
VWVAEFQIDLAKMIQIQTFQVLKTLKIVDYVKIIPNFEVLMMMNAPHIVA